MGNTVSIQFQISGLRWGTESKKQTNVSMRKILNILSLYMGLLVSAVLFFSFITPGYAMDVTLQWDANSEPDLNHYVVYWATSSGNYSARQTHDFSDPDTGDSHSQSQWQISKESDFSSLLHDITSGSYLTSLTVPHSILDTIQLPQIRRSTAR